MSKIDQNTIKHISDLANIPVSTQETKKLVDDFLKTLKVIDELRQVSVEDVEPTHQVTQLTNVMREDEVAKEKMLTQEEALANTESSHKGYFVVPRILEK
ncbi:Asp-tRNA(Asn)/Glu-tRNA(Gln) amidotransferase subunit GatC [Candidatus Micrarchaeota archaeon]|jgi:aspartyl/glutamyl-tRNA(Asn/Gln) amidotransferase C subunit|nr:Asp-tRNA(Asn)/Glu-tRNA(Gln) amidotransferase subunit GatC [Candidatus Micrarchaeota archaeon]